MNRFQIHPNECSTPPGRIACDHPHAWGNGQLFACQQGNSKLRHVGGVPPGNSYVIQEISIPYWLRVYLKASPEHDHKLRWEFFRISELEAFEVMMRRVVMEEIDAVVRDYEAYRSALRAEMERRRVELWSEQREMARPSRPPDFFYSVLALPSSAPPPGGEDNGDALEAYQNSVPFEYSSRNDESIAGPRRIPSSARSSHIYDLPPLPSSPCSVDPRPDVLESQNSCAVLDRRVVLHGAMTPQPPNSVVERLLLSSVETKV